MVALGLTPDEGLTPAQLYGLLGALDGWLVSELGEMPEPFDLLVVGGAAVSLQWDPARLTNDVDVISDMLPPVLWEGAASVAVHQKGVRTDWLNDAAKIGALSTEVDARPTLMYEGRTLRVYGAGARYVLAMKLVAGRAVDLGDMPTLLDAAEFESLDDALSWTARAHPHRQIPVAAQYILEEAWEERMARSGSRRPSAAKNAGWFSVRPATGATWGWELVMQQPGGETLTGGPRHPSMEAALDAAAFACSVLDDHGSLRVGQWEQGGELDGRVPGEPRPTLLPVPQADGWVLQLTRCGRRAGDNFPNLPDPRRGLSSSALPPEGQQGGWCSGTAGAATGTRVRGLCLSPIGAQVPPLRPPAPEVDPMLAMKLSRSGTLGVHVRPNQRDNQGWEVTTTDPDGSPRQLSVRHPTVEEAEHARDFLVRLVNVHPRLHIPGSAQRSSESDVGSAAAPPSGEPPTVGLYSPDQGARWYVQCQNPDGTVDATSPPYPTREAAANVLDQLGRLSVVTSDSDIGHRAVADPTSSACPCSRKGWRCGHIEPPAPEPPDRGHGLSL